MMLINLLLALVCGIGYWVTLDERVGRWRGLIAWMCAIFASQFIHRALP